MNNVSLSIFGTKLIKFRNKNTYVFSTSHYSKYKEILVVLTLVEILSFQNMYVLLCTKCDFKVLFATKCENLDNFISPCDSLTR